MQNRVPGKALDCNFSRYIRDGSRNERRKGRFQVREGKRVMARARVKKGRKKESTRANFCSLRERMNDDRMWRPCRITRRFPKSSRRYPRLWAPKGRRQEEVPVRVLREEAEESRAISSLTKHRRHSIIPEIAQRSHVNVSRYVN